MGTCDLRGVMLASASRTLPASRVPPSPEVPSEKHLGSITDAVTSTLSDLSMQLPRQPAFMARAARIPAPHARRRKSGDGSRLPTVPLRFTAARLCRHRQPKSALAALYPGRNSLAC